MYAKLNDNNLRYAPKSVTVGRTHYNPPPVEWLAENGYLPVEFTPRPEPVEGYTWVSRWEQTETAIVLVWEQVELPEEADESDYIGALRELGVSVDD